MSRILALVSVLLLTGCTAAQAAPEPTRVAFVGDSLTNYWSDDFSHGDIAADSWVNVPLADGYVFAGGWAEIGAHTRDMLAGVQPVDADMLVLMAGTNDQYFGDTTEESLVNIPAIVEKVGAPEVVLSAIPPMFDKPEQPPFFNGKLRELADAHGWTFVDPWGDVRDGDQWRPKFTLEGLHPNAEGERLVGQRILAALDEVTGR